MTFSHMPKIELHLHHEAAAPPSFIKQIAKEKNIDLGDIFTDDGSYIFKNFEHFLKVYDATCLPLQTPEDFRRLTYAALEETAKSGVIYCETFVAPGFCGRGDVIAWREFLAAMKEGSEAAERDFGIVHRTIATILRHEGPENAIDTAKCAVDTFGDYLTGFGMAGAEMMHRPGDFAYSFDMAREAGLALTCHAGEWGGAQMITETLDHLKVARLGHGIHAIQSQDLMKRLIDEDITLEVCPGSNVVLKAVDSWKDHPIAALRDAGVKVTVSTDDPPFFHTTMNDEFENLHKTFGWDESVFQELNNTALAAAFCDEPTREALAKRLSDSAL